MSAPSFILRFPQPASVVLLTLIVAGYSGTCRAAGGEVGSSARTATGNGTPSVGPRTGAVMVAGGGQQGPEVFAKFVELAGGPDAGEDRERARRRGGRLVGRRLHSGRLSRAQRAVERQSHF